MTPAHGGRRGDGDRNHHHPGSLYAEQARLANIGLGEAMLHITRVSYLANGAAVELTHSYCRSDYYEFVAESRR